MEELERRLREEASFADVIEIWLDSIADVRLAEIFFEEENIEAPLLFVNKAPFEGGDFLGTPEERVDVLVEMFERGAAYVDVALQTPEPLIKRLVKARGKRGKLIISYHNFKTTPSLKELKTIVLDAKKKGADIVKLATFVATLDENVELLEITRWAKSKKIALITVGMGDAGRLSRVMTPLFGSLMYYAPLIPAHATAPGQFIKGDLEQIWREMGF